MRVRWKAAAEAHSLEGNAPSPRRVSSSEEPSVPTQEAGECMHVIHLGYT